MSKRREKKDPAQNALRIVEQAIQSRLKQSNTPKKKRIPIEPKKA